MDKDKGSIQKIWKATRAYDAHIIESSTICHNGWDQRLQVYSAPVHLHENPADCDLLVYYGHAKGEEIFRIAYFQDHLETYLTFEKTSSSYANHSDRPDVKNRRRLDYCEPASWDELDLLIGRFKSIWWNYKHMDRLGNKAQKLSKKFNSDDVRKYLVNIESDLNKEMSSILDSMKDELETIEDMMVPD